MGQPGSVPASFLVLRPKAHLDDGRGQEDRVLDPEEPEQSGTGQRGEREGAEPSCRLLDKQQRNAHQTRTDLLFLRISQSGKHSI